MINSKFRDWNGIYTNFATWLAGLFLLRVVNLVADVISWTNQRPGVMQVMLRIGTLGTCPSLCLALATPSSSNMPAWYPLRLDPWQLSLKYSNSATELLGDSVAQLVRAWQAICQVVGSSPALSHCHFFLGRRPTCHISNFVYL